MDTITLPKNPTTALLLNLFLPGVGYFYIGQTAKGFVTLITALILIIFFAGIGLFIPILTCIDAYALAHRLKNGQPIETWDFSFAQQPSEATKPPIGNTKTGLLDNRVVQGLIGVIGWLTFYLGLLVHLRKELVDECIGFGCLVPGAIYLWILGSICIGIPFILVLLRRWWVAAGWVIAAIVTPFLWPAIASALANNQNSGWLTYRAGEANLPGGVADLEIDKQDRVWIATACCGLSVISPAGSWMTYNTGNSGLSQDQVDAVVIDDLGNVWAHNHAGLSRLDTTGQWTSYTIPNVSEDSFYDKTFAVDRENRIWVGHAHGLSVLEADGNWTTYTSSNSELSDDEISGLAIDSKGQVWVGTRDGRLNMLSVEHHWTSYAIPEESDWAAAFDEIAISFDKQGRVWVSTSYDINVLELDGTWTGFIARSSDMNSLYYELLIDQQDRIWVGTLRNGVYAFSPTAQRTAYNIDNSGLVKSVSSSGRSENPEISALAVDSLGRIWIGTYNGLSVFDVNGVKSGQ